MIIVLLLFFKSICLYCQRLVLYIHDRWINPKNVRLLKEAAEAKGSRFQIEEYRQVKKSKKRRCATNSSTSGQAYISSLSNSLADGDSCRFCANTPQGYCRHHFHLQELHVQKQQRQQKFWCPLSGIVAGTNRSTEYRQLRKIKRELKRNIQQQRQHKSPKISTILYENSTRTNNYPSSSSPRSSSTPPSDQLANSENSSCLINDSGYQTISENISTSSSLACKENGNLASAVTSSNSSYNDYFDIELSTPSTPLMESTYSFGTCCETPNDDLSLPIPKTATPFNSFVSCEYTTLSTSYL